MARELILKLSSSKHNTARQSSAEMRQRHGLNGASAGCVRHARLHTKVSKVFSDARLPLLAVSVFCPIFARRSLATEQPASHLLEAGESAGSLSQRFTTQSVIGCICQCNTLLTKGSILPTSQPSQLHHYFIMNPSNNLT